MIEMKKPRHANLHPRTYHFFFTMSLRFTAASLSRIRKPNLPKNLSPLKPKSPSKLVSKTTKVPERLEVVDHNIQLDFELRGSADIEHAIDLVLHNLWAERTTFHTRFFSREAKKTALGNDLLFLLRGLLMETKAEIIKYRTQQLPTGGMITTNQLYSIFAARGNTFVDRSLEMCIREGIVKKFVITNALPVILRSGAIGQYHKVTYGYENMEVVVKTEHYLDLIDECIKDCDKDTLEALSCFKDFVKNLPTALVVTSEDLETRMLSHLVRTGFITLTSNHHNEIDTHQYSIAYPRCGTFLKMINAGRTWVVKTLSKATYKEFLEDVLFDKWEGKNMACFRKPFYGYDLLWILADALGAGVVEAFSTPVGRGWRLTGKL